MEAIAPRRQGYVTILLQVLVPLLILVMLSACSTEPTKSVPLRLSFKVLRGPMAKPLTARLTDANGNVLEIATAELVLREVEFESTDADCDSSGHDDDCEEVEQGPFLVSLPVDATTPVVVLEAELPVGTWEEVEFEVHKVDRDDQADAAFLNTTGFPEDVSIRVTGTWTPAGGSPVAFTFTTDLDVEQEIEFEPPMIVREGETKNVTFVVDLNTWFRDATGILVDPQSANKGGANESLVENTIKTSIEGFEDDDRDGVED